ncbi:laminin subunit alpha-1-like [Neodiprion fabricii]|uniref:laminin subunit alpha-1-like n=1 Tax=Neodiprion fabricii TaxID=2872261 RepID=UPI001ED960DF|nr:laminin subunit alpha-1-like [Neodiprion fabricii]
MAATSSGCPKMGAIVPLLVLLVGLLLVLSRNAAAEKSKEYKMIHVCKNHFLQQLYRKIDGAVLTSQNERNLDCAITFQTHSILQRFMLRFDRLQLDCNDHLYIYDGAHAVGNYKADLSCRNTKQSVGAIFTRTNFVTLKYVTDGWGTDSNGFRLVITAVKDPKHTCKDFKCNSREFCIDTDLVCDGVNHCGDGSDEATSTLCANTKASTILGMERTWFAVAIVSTLITLAGIGAGMVMCFCKQRTSTPRHLHNANNAQNHPPVSFPWETRRHGIGRSLKNGGLFPSVFNVAAKAEIHANATCGEEGPETFCKPSEPTRCAVCDPNSPDPGKRHDASHALDSNRSRWWQSPTLAAGDRFEYVTITLDLKQVYQIAYVIVKAGYSPLPAAWILERSLDGSNFFPWQYYAPTDEECWTRYSVPPVTGKPTYVSDTEVVCTSSYYRPTPMENGAIHTYLINGRPGALNHSSELEEFTQARFVRLRFQGLRPMGETIVDKRRGFYSIKEINIGGHCLCSGHASQCRYSVHHRRQECECERHTCGERCNKCCPIYNQVPWRPGTSGRGFHCEKCNCHGHATACMYDPEVANQRSSLDIRDKYRGGGVCLNCTEHTTGINCEKCQVGYYRPNGVLPNASEPCLPCTCDLRGSTGFCTPDDSFTRIGKVAGACECKPGYSGYKCDQCAAGYRQFPDCMPCPCDSRGVLPSHDCEGDCLCKANVAREFCSFCKPGYFALTRENEDGCLPCICSGLTRECSDARLTFGMLSTREGWLVSDMNASRVVFPEIEPESGSLVFDPSSLDYTPYWLAPKVYGGNRLTSYGSNITFTVTWIVMRGDSSGKPTIEPDVILIGGNGMQIAYGEERYSGQDAMISVPLGERGWYHVKEEVRNNIPHRLRKTEYRGDPVTRSQMLRVLADLERVMIRARYHTEQIEGRLSEVILTTAELSDSSADNEGSTLVEMCNCPAGYAGLSCERCAWGYVSEPANASDHLDRSEKCVKCDCNGHAATCDLRMGECGVCEHNTVGPKCDRCAAGYYGDPSQGTSDDCKKCSCPLGVESNNFSPSCQLEDPDNPNGGYVCTQCPKGYTGDHCESCDVGYFGSPTIPGKICEPCSCNGGVCDQETGRCLECRGNTEGWKCDRCKKMHYGDPLEPNCKACDCDPLGSLSLHCDSNDGQCLCKPLFIGRTCSRCIEGFGNVTAGCVECNCGEGAARIECDAVTGQCQCLQGVAGQLCDRCDFDHYGLNAEGCLGCRCNVLGSLSHTCDIVTGQCQCKAQVTGRACDRCQTGFWGLTTKAGCLPCDCDPIGAANSSCEDDTGHCHCRPGIGGPRCDFCLPGYYGFSNEGCRLCEPCNKPGHICDPDTGRCVCPKLTLGENCDRCRSGAYGFVPGAGCKSCACSPGATRAQCNPDGQCSCRDGFEGLRCDRCDVGYYGYPRCKPCGCSAHGTVQCGEKICPCNDTGQCPCKENAVGRKCGECKAGTYGLAFENPKGCTECFCFGRSTSCHGAALSWGQRRLPRPRTLYVNKTVSDIMVTNFGTSYILPAINGGLNVSNGHSVIPGNEGDVTLPATLHFNYPLYWELPESFLGDKVISYGGYIQFVTDVEGGEPLATYLRYPVVLLQGNSRIVLEHYANSPIESNRYKIRMHESHWHLKNQPDIPVSREILMIALQKVQKILIKASDYSEFTKVVLLEASLDAAVLTPTRSPPFATDVEICKCPSEYTGTSCQDPNIGYYRWCNNEIATSTIVIDLIGQARPCQCNGRSGVCDTETGRCLNCSENTTGERCELCEDSFYGHPEIGGCKPCPCPHADKRFSSTCEIHSDIDVVCHCKPGYTGSKCERCSYGYFGAPTTPGGSCVPCNCNPAGSLSDSCLAETGQCNCRPGSTGRDCSQCTKPRHVFIEDICTSCNDNCTGILLDDLDTMSSLLDEETVHIANGYIPPPWQDLSYVNDNASLLFEDIKLERNLRHKIENIPWHQYRKLKKRVTDLLDRAPKCLNQTSNHKSRSDDIKNNAYSTQLKILDIHQRLKETSFQLSRYASNDKKIEIENALNQATKALNKIESVNLFGRTSEMEAIINNATDYIDWLNSLNDGAKDLIEVKKYANEYNEKVEDFDIIIENTMENLYTYDGLYKNYEKEFNHVNNQYLRINTLKEETTESIDKGKTLVAEASGLLVDSQSNVQDLPELKFKLANLTDALTSREGILYRLNYEYEDMYVIPAKKHAQNLTRYVDDYVSLFAHTRNETVNPLKASQVYQDIVDALNTAKLIGREAKVIADDIHDKTFPGGAKLSSVLELTESMVEKSSDLWNEAKKQETPAISLRNQLEAQKQGIANLKNTLNSTGIRDNQMNVKLQELKANSIETRNKLQVLLKDNEHLKESFAKTTKEIADYEDIIANELRPKIHELKREGDSKISLASEKLTEVQSNIKRADAKLISLTYASAKRKNEFDKWNHTLAEKLQYLRDKIAEARNTADGIRISLKSVNTKKCVRSYRPSILQPGTTTTIIITLAIEGKHKQGSLFYLPSTISDDFVALEMVNRKIRFVWNVGGGTGIVTHPEVIEPGDITGDNFWYRIEAERTRNVGKLSVRKQTSTSGRYLPVLNSTYPEYGRFDITPGDRVWLGGIPESQRRPPELIASNGLPGCVHQVVLDGKPIGLWNFVTSAPDMACEACVEGVEDAHDDIAYSFNGEGYAVRNRVPSGPYSKYTFGVSITFRTFDENALLFLAVNPKNNQHVMIFLREGRVVLHVGYGSNISIDMLSMHKYNTGNWTNIDAFRQYQPRKGIEQCSLSVGGNNDKRIGAPSQQPKKDDIPDLMKAKYYIGGVPPSFKSGKKLILPSPVSFLGCMSNIFINQEGYDPMAEQYYGVEPSCSNKHTKIVGFYGNGYFEHHAHTLKKTESSFSFSFRTLQETATLLLSTFQRPNEEESLESRDRYLSGSYYSVAIVAGQVQVRIDAGKGELLLQSNDTFNDGKYHSICVTKKRKAVELRVDDAYQASGRLPTGAAVRLPELSGGMYIGGLPGAINDTNLVTTNIPLIGAIKDIIFNDKILRLDEPVSFERAAIGRSGPSMGKHYAMHTASASLSRGMSTQPEGCQKVPYYSLEPGALKFGDKPHSHTQLYLNYEKFWEKKYVIEFDFRTYYPNGLLFITPGIKLKHYMMMVVRNGQLSLIIKTNQQKKEILFRSTFNDGNWHHVVVRHDERTLTLSVDSQAPQTIRIQRRIGLVTMMYMGGLPESGTPIPEQVVVKLETLKGCIKGLKVNGIIHDMVGTTSRPYNIGQCFPSVESGAYFQDDAYAIYKNNFELGALLELELEFRTSEFSGVLLSITSPGGSPSLSLELFNGKVIMSGKLGDNNALYVEQQFPSSYTICDNRWHRIQALYNDEQLALKVDELDQNYGLPQNGNYHFARETVVSSPLYIGGLPESAPKGMLVTRENFSGCIRNVMIDGERRDWTDMVELHNIHLSSCPIQQ